jgi:hypothetical protein
MLTEVGTSRKLESPRMPEKQCPNYDHIRVSGLEKLPASAFAAVKVGQYPKPLMSVSRACIRKFDLRGNQCERSSS